MTIRDSLLLMLTGLVTALISHVPHSPIKPSSPIAKNATSPSDSAELTTRLPLSFESNAGQTDESVKFLARGRGYTLFLTATEAVFRFSAPSPIPPLEAAGGARLGARTSRPPSDNVDKMSALPGESVLRMSFPGAANPTQSIEGVNALPGNSNYFIGNDPKNWRTNITNYAQAAYRSLYPGIDLLFRGNDQSALEYDFIIAPHADPNQIRLRFSGARAFQIDSQGNLEFDLPSGPFRQSKPVAYQDRDGKRTFVEAHFVLRETGDVAFEIADYDRDLPLVIDPALSLIYSTYFGGGEHDGSVRLFVDSEGNAYVGGVTISVNFPLLGNSAPPLKNVYAGGNRDGFIFKLSPDGRRLLYSTYIGASALDQVTGIAVDSQGKAVFSGITDSPDFPKTVSFSPAPSGWDAFALKLGAEGNNIIYSGVLGGAKIDYAYAVAVDSTDAAYFTGITQSADFPKKNAVQPALNGYSDAFLTKISADGSSVVSSTYFGGGEDDVGYALAIDSSNYIYLAGVTSSTHFPVAHSPNAGVLQATFGGGDMDSFIGAFDPNGAVWYATYLGGNGRDSAAGIALHGRQVYVTGYTASTNFPVAAPFQASMASPGNPYFLNDAFVTKIAEGGGSLVFSTYLGGAGDDHAFGIDADPDGNVFVAGNTQSSNFPMESPYQDKPKSNHTVFITELDSTGRKLLWSTFFGGSASDDGMAVGIDGKRNIYVAGTTGSNNFPTKVPYQSIPGGLGDVFVAKFGKGGRVYLR